MPRLRSSLKELKNPEYQPQLPHRAESHHLRNLYREMNDIETCEGTGAFRVGSYLLVEHISTASFDEELKHIGAVVKSIWSGVGAVVIPSNMLKGKGTQIALRAHLQRATRLSGARLSSLLHFSEGVSGTASRVTPPEFFLPEPTPTDVDSSLIGKVLHKGRPTALDFRIPIDQYVHDVGIFGNPGSGKTNSAFQIVHEHYRHGIPFLVITPSKREWRLLGNCIPDLRIILTRHIRFNFMDVPEGVHVSTHISNITTCFTAWWPSEGIIVEHITKIFQLAFINAGWNLHTGDRGRPILLTDLYAAMEEVAESLKYGMNLKKDFYGALTSRFDTLVNDPILSVMFNCERGLKISDLLDHNTILELNELPDSHKALVTSLLLVSITEYLDANSAIRALQNKLRHLLVLEEAHHVLKNVVRSSATEGHASQQQAIDTIVQLLRESRGLGLGIVLIDQLPAMLAPEAVKLVGIMVIHALFDISERLLVGSRANLTEEQMSYIGHLKCGEAIVHQGLNGAAIHIQVRKFDADPDPTKPPWTDERVLKHMKAFYDENPHLLTVNIPAINCWKPDEKVLTNLRLVIDGNEFPEEYQKRRTIGEDAVQSYLRGIIADVVDTVVSCDISAPHIEHYLTILTDLVRDRLERLELLKPADDTRSELHA